MSGDAFMLHFPLHYFVGEVFTTFVVVILLHLRAKCYYICDFIAFVVRVLLHFVDVNICDPASQNQQKVAWPSFVL